MKRREFPILEHDPTQKALLEPTELINPIDISERCVICFFQDVIDGLLDAGKAVRVHACRSEMGEHPIYEMEVDEQRIAVFHPGVGAPLAAGLLEEVIALGCSKFIVCGGAGTLKSEFDVGHIVVPVSAVRDEGTSYHYLPPAREVEASSEAVSAIDRTLERHRVPHVKGKTWTTDGIYRETPDKIELRRGEGCLTVEMEAAAFFAVARFRGVTLGQMLYSADDVGGEEWDHRDWVDRSSVREKLFWLAVEACLEL